MAAPLILSDIGEDALVKRLTHLLPPLASDVATGPGDDCAVIRNAPNQPLTLLKTDTVVEGVHFLPGESMQRVGWKALCRAISDIASMGGHPQHALISLAVPVETECLKLENLYQGIASAATAYGISVVGGETSKTTGPLICSVFLTGSVAPERCKLRSGGQLGDLIMVTGHLVGSLASGRHLDFSPRLAEGQWLAQWPCVHSMMDLSDGLASDGLRLANASQCGICIDELKIPCNAGCGVKEALEDGEDFELLISVQADSAVNLLSDWKTVFPNLPLTIIGSLTEPRNKLNTKELLQTCGYDHFKRP